MDEQQRCAAVSPLEVQLGNVVLAHRQSAAIAASEHEADAQAFVDAISVDWTAE